MIEEYSYGVIPFYDDKNGHKEVLVIQNRSGWHRGFPKGHIDKGESPADAAKREFGEETGIYDIELDENKIFEEHYIFPRGEEMVSKHVFYYIGYVGNQNVTLQDEELSDYRWVGVSEVHDLLTHDAVCVVFDEVLKYLG